MIRAQQLGRLPNLTGQQTLALGPLQTGNLTATQTTGGIDINSITNLMLTMMVMVMMMKMMGSVTESVR